MATIAIIGAGFAGHTAALYLGKHLGRDHDVVMINKYDTFNYIPSWVWVGINRMKPEKTAFKLAPVYKKMKVRFVHGSVTEVHPDENFVLVNMAKTDETTHINYDYLLVATGPNLNFAGTEGLGPHDGHTHSICTLDHALSTRDAYCAALADMKQGQRKTIVCGTGHPGATCQGAAFEYITNIHKDLVRHGVRDQADLIWLSNERELGDFGVGGIASKHNGALLTSKDFIETAFADYNIRYEVQKGVYKVDEQHIYWEDYEGNRGVTPYDFAMLIPQFTGPRLKWVGKDGEDVASKVTNPAGFVKVDAVYGLSHDQMMARPDAWPATYQNPDYPNIFAAGIAFAPPGSISIPHTTPNGMSITAAPPRTGMVSAITGRVVALNIVDLVKTGEMTHTERMTEMAAACIASMGDSLWDGSAAVMVIYPVVPDPTKYTDTHGRDSFVTHMEMGLAGAWMKRLIHTTMIYKLKGNPFWNLIPE